MMCKIITTFLLLIATIARADEAKPVELFNGKDLTGWTMAGPGKFEVKDGELRTVGGMGLLWHQKEVTNFLLTLEFKVSRKEDNAGVFIRFADPGGDPWKAVKEGEEIQIHDGAGKKGTGSVYSAHDASELASKPVGEWNTMQITVVGKKITVKVNDKVVVNEFVSKRFQPKGYVGLQNHDDKSNVAFRNVRLTELPSPTAVAAPLAIDASRKPGLVGKYYKDIDSFEDLTKATSAATPPFLLRVDEKIAFYPRPGQFHGTKLSSKFAARWDGYLRVENPGTYTIVMFSNDASRLYVGEKMVLENTNADPDHHEEVMLELEKGDYPIHVDYYNGPLEGGIFIGKTESKDKHAAFDKTMLFHDDAQQAGVKWDEAAWKNTQWSYREWAATSGDPWIMMDYGAFISSTVELAEKNHALKGITIHLGDKDEAAVTFDTDLLRYAGGWTGGFLQLTGVAFDGSHGTNPTPDGSFILTTPPLPGAALGEPSEKLTKDPRAKPYGPIPKEIAKYKGLRVNGKRVVLHYTVGDVDVHESPWAKTVGEDVVITRSIKIGASDHPLTLLVADSCAVPDGVKLVKQGDNQYAIFPPRKVATTYGLAFSRSKIAPPAADDVDALLKPGPARWTEPVVTKGEVSAATQPYVVDTLTVPEKNPWNSWMRFGGVDFFTDGRAAVSTWSGDVWIVSGIDDKLEKLTWKRFATGLFQPLGLKIVDDTIYALGRDQITRLKDTNNDGEADEYECFNNDCQVSRSFHEFAFDLQTDPQGNFYFTKAGPVRPGGKGWEEITDHNGAILRVSKDGSKFEVFATGVRAPNGMSVGPTGEVTVGENEGTWAPTCRISLVKQGDFLGVVDLAHKATPPKDYLKPICWLPHGEADNSSGGQAWVTSDKWGPFANRLLHTSYGKCALFLVMSETVDNQIQGGVVQLPQLTFLTGICRPRFHPIDKQLYIAGLRGWQTTATKDAALQRVRYTGASVKMPSDLRVHADGVSITFTTELDESAVKDVGNYGVEQWNYIWSSEYGSAEYSVVEPKEKGHDGVDVKTATLSADKKTVTLKFDEMVMPVMQMKIQMKLKSKDGAALEYSIYNTVNKVPKTSATPTTAAAARP